MCVMVTHVVCNMFAFNRSLFSPSPDFTGRLRLAPVVSVLFCHSLSLAVFVSLIPFHCFTAKTIFSTTGYN